MEALCCVMGLCTGSQHATMTAIVNRWCLPSERGRVIMVDNIVSVGSCLLNCLVVAHLMVVLGWRATMLLMCAVTMVALLGVKFFVTDGPIAGAGRLRLSEGEAALFRAEDMLCDKTSTELSPTTFTSVAVGPTTMVTRAKASMTWVLIAVEMSVAWR